MSKCSILSYGCSSSAGKTAQDFWLGLWDGVDHARPLSGVVSPVCTFPEKWSGSVLSLLTSHLVLAWQDCQRGLDSFSRANFKKSARIGIILASTKGCIDDWVWDWVGQKSPDLSRDPLTPLLESFIETAGLNPTDTLCVSNACTSSLGAVFLGREWLNQDRVDYVLILAADHAGPFVQKGFEKLKAVTTTRSQPFGRLRDGLCLGEAAAVILLSSRNDEEGVVEIEGVATHSEGFAVTRPNQSGASLLRACRSLPGIPKRQPDLIIAHGTGTLINDLTEDQVFTKLFGENSVPITATKWSIGHTLGASAAMDLIAACEIFKRKSVFSIANTREFDPTMKSNFLSVRQDFNGQRILVTSLGFGGVHAAALLKATSRAGLE